ncbi:uncharacterized protein LOC136076297 [Hydra vulgaris]
MQNLLKKYLIENPEELFRAFKCDVQDGPRSFMEVLISNADFKTLFQVLHLIYRKRFFLKDQSYKEYADFSKSINLINDLMNDNYICVFEYIQYFDERKDRQDERKDRFRQDHYKVMSQCMQYVIDICYDFHYRSIIYPYYIRRYEYKLNHVFYKITQGLSREEAYPLIKALLSQSLLRYVQMERQHNLSDARQVVEPDKDCPLRQTTTDRTMFDIILRMQDDNDELTRKILALKYEELLVNKEEYTKRKKMIKIALRDGAKCPTLGTSGSIGYDLYPLKDVEISPHFLTIIDTGVVVSPPDSYYFQIAPRSSTFTNSLLLHPGIIDTDYRDDIKVLICNLTNETIYWSKDKAIAQMILKKKEMLPVLKCCEKELDETQRNKGRFGSTNDSDDIMDITCTN